MADPPKFDRYQFYRATVRLRRGKDWNVKPEAEANDGRRYLLMTDHLMTAEDNPIYAGEWTFEVVDAPPRETGGFFLAQGDLVDFAPVSFEEGMAARRLARIVEFQRPAP